MDQLHLQSKRQEKRVEVWGGWRAGRLDRTKGVRDRTMVRPCGGTGARQQVCSTTSRPAPEGTSSATQEKGFLQGCLNHTLHSHTHTCRDTQWYGHMWTIEAPSWPSPGHDSVATPGTHLIHTQRTIRSKLRRQRLLKVRTFRRRFSPRVFSLSAYTAPSSLRWWGPNWIRLVFVIYLKVEQHWRDEADLVIITRHQYQLSTNCFVRTFTTFSTIQR